MRKLIFAVLILTLMIVPAATAQDDEVVITLTVPEFFKDAFSETLLGQFEAQTGIKAQLISSTTLDAVPPPPGDIDAHLDGLAEFASAADVLLVSSNTISLEGTRAGFFMDLSPLANADPDLDAGDFIPQAWQSFQWDRGIWALPVAVDVYVMVYNPAAFDEAGIAYPNAAWTFDDFVTAARTLSFTNAEGEVEPGFFDFGTSTYLLRSLLGHNLADEVALTPDFSNPELERYLTTWQELRDEGVIGGFTGGGRFIAIGGDASESPPMSIQRSFALATFPGNPDAVPPSGTLLPGSTAGLDIQGLAVSAGTRYPEQAYELVKFLTYSPEVANGMFGAAPARLSLADVEVEPNPDQSGPIFEISSLDYIPENQAIIDAAFQNALSLADMQYVDYIVAAYALMENEGLDAQSALQQMEADAITNLEIAAAARENTAIVVATPIPEVVLAPDEIALDFGVASFINPLPNQQLWDQLTDSFVAADSEVGAINFDTDFGLDISDMASRYDCFYMPSNAVPGGNLAGVISPDPFIDADPNFDQGDVINTVMQQVEFDNRIWALPIVIQPEVLRYNAELFERAGVPLPQDGWTVDEFVDALQRLKPTPDDPIPFIPRDLNGQYLYTLIAAFGGLPIDYRTDPPTINFTDAGTVDAIQQVLDLAKNGYLDYSPLAGEGGVNVSISVGSIEDEDPIYTHTLSGLSFFARLDEDGNLAQDSYALVTYPRGSRFLPITMEIGTAYISAEAENPEACYRWLSELSRHPELFSAMPARRSLINDPAVTVNQSAELTNLYNQIDSILSDPNAVISAPTFRPGANSPGNFFRQFWLNRAFDRYVTEDADLETELAQAEQFTRDYETCAAGIEDENPTSQDERMAYFQQFNQCATSVDPSFG